jgi:farnesyl diphosphate synthase
MTFEGRLAETAGLVEQRVTQLLGGDLLAAAPERLRAAMQHAVLSGGKRLRPHLVVESARLFNLSPSQAVDAAAAIELVHCYSLVHDDLPCMDNDELRRGVPTVWRAYDEATAVLTGDGLLTLAFEMLARAETHASPAVRAAMVLGLARASGASGMVGGQQLDIEAETGNSPLHTPQGVAMIHRMKTGALIAFAAEAGAILAEAPESARVSLAAYGKAVGEAFQIADDVLDVGGDVAVMGKTVGKDAAAGKATAVAALGLAGARHKLAALESEALSALMPFGDAGAILAQTATFIIRRTQ